MFAKTMYVHKNEGLMFANPFQQLELDGFANGELIGEYKLVKVLKVNKTATLIPQSSNQRKSGTKK